MMIEIRGATLYLADCREILPTLAGYNCFVTDPPYGIEGGSGTLGKASQKTKYASNFVDSPKYIKEICAPAISAMLKECGRGVITPGANNCFSYPPPDDMGIVYQPAATGMSKWGRCTSQPVLFYGRDPRVGKTILPKHVIQTGKTEEERHPCSKPMKVAEWMVHRASLDGETVIDPFMGAGSFGVACVNQGRKYIGIELDERYFEVACERIEAAYSQGRLF